MFAAEGTNGTNGNTNKNQNHIRIKNKFQREPIMSSARIIESEVF